VHLALSQVLRRDPEIVGPVSPIDLHRMLTAACKHRPPALQATLSIGIEPSVDINRA
jgi:hypothetical protein